MGGAVMGKGLRIHHPTERNGILLVPYHHHDPSGAEHWIHIHLDENGDSIVSEGVWGQLKEVAELRLCDHGLFVLNEIPDPPTLVIGSDTEYMLRVCQLDKDGEVYPIDLQAVAQSFAPNGVKARITNGSN
jgi:hypothetical protein